MEVLYPYLAISLLIRLPEVPENTGRSQVPMDLCVQGAVRLGGPLGWYRTNDQLLNHKGATPISIVKPFHLPNQLC